MINPSELIFRNLLLWNIFFQQHCTGLSPETFLLRNLVLEFSCEFAILAKTSIIDVWQGPTPT